MTNNDLGDRVLTLENEVAATRTDVGLVRAEVRDLKGDIRAGFDAIRGAGDTQTQASAANRKFSIQIGVGLFSTFFAALFGFILPAAGVLAGCLFFAIDARTAPFRQQSENNSHLIQEHGQILARLTSDLGANAQRDAASETDRVRLNSTVTDLKKEIGDGKAERKANEAKFAAALIEIETQFRSMGQMANLRSASDHNLISFMWEKLFGTAYPKAEYYPDMSQPKPGGS